MTPPEPPISLTPAQRAQLEEELLAPMRRVRDERDGWRSLALARGALLVDAVERRAVPSTATTTAAQTKVVRAERVLERLGVNPQTGRPLPQPKPAKGKK